jgi:hypothetical protein
MEGTGSMESRCRRIVQNLATTQRTALRKPSFDIRLRGPLRRGVYHFERCFRTWIPGAYS